MVGNVLLRGSRGVSVLESLVGTYAQEIASVQLLSCTPFSAGLISERTDHTEWDAERGGKLRLYDYLIRYINIKL